MDRALTDSRHRGITVECQQPDGHWVVAKRPTSLHGAAIAIMLYEDEWEAQGYTQVRVMIQGQPLQARTCLGLPFDMLPFLGI